MCQKAIYPGSFDPVTYGHIDLIKRAQDIFSEIIVAVAHNPQKKPLFSVKERLDMLKKATVGLEGIIIDDFDGFAFRLDGKIFIAVIINDHLPPYTPALRGRAVRRTSDLAFFLSVVFFFLDGSPPR